MEMSMRERIARALFERETVRQTGVTPDSSWETPPGYFAAADAVLAELREPSEAMIEAGVTADTGCTLGDRVTNCWQAMIDAAKEQAPSDFPPPGYVVPEKGGRAG